VCSLSDKPKVNIMSLVAWILLGLLVISMITNAVLVIGAPDSIVAKFLDAIWKHAPGLFRKFPAVTKWWAAKRLQKQLRYQLKTVTDDSFNIDLSVKFCEGADLKTIRDGKRLVVVYHPGENPAENFIGTALEVAKNCIPNGNAVIKPELKNCITLFFAKNLIESHSAEYARVFASQFLLGDDQNSETNALKANPYHEQLETLDHKHLFTRVYLKSLIKFGDTFDPNSDRTSLQSTVEKFTERLSAIGEHFLLGNIPNLVEKTDPLFSPDFEYFFDENGLRVNLMLIRSEERFQIQDVAAYVRKAKALVERGVELNFVLSCVTSIKLVTHADYLKRVDFAEKVTRAIKAEVKELAFQYESKRFVDFAGLAYPVYCALFTRKTPGPHFRKLDTSTRFKPVKATRARPSKRKAKQLSL
jgi:hypothetical protein